MHIGDLWIAGALATLLSLLHSLAGYQPIWGYIMLTAFSVEQLL
jgi:quinol-cytochrome oxidoreductase complex cytochrome b subunit